MMFLVDTNIWLERLLDQEKSKERSPYPPADRRNFNTKKRAREAAKRDGNGAEPIHHPDGKYGPHYHPNVDGPKSHEHYNYPKNRR